MTTKMPGIYEIRNTVTLDSYVGKSINLIGRREYHFGRLARGRHHVKRLQAEFVKYGSIAFVWRPLKFCSVESLSQWEQHFVNVLHPTYNQAVPPSQWIPRDRARFNPTLQAMRRQLSHR